MRWSEGAASVLLRALQRCAAALATSAARHSAMISPGARFLDGGRVANIAGRRERIIVGNGSRIAGQLLVFRHGGTIRVGDWCYIGEGSRVWSAQSIHIGDRVLISHNVNVHDCDSHSFDAHSRHRQFCAIAMSGHPEQADDVASGPILIEDDVWIGFNSIILKGSRIGARSIVAAGSLVTGDVPADSLYIGNDIRRKLNADDRGK